MMGMQRERKNELTYQKMGRSKKRKKENVKIPSKKRYRGESRGMCVHDYKQHNPHDWH